MIVSALIFLHNYHTRFSRSTEDDVIEADHEAQMVLGTPKGLPTPPSFPPDSS